MIYSKYPSIIFIMEKVWLLLGFIESAAPAVYKDITKR